MVQDWSKCMLKKFAIIYLLTLGTGRAEQNSTIKQSTNFTTASENHSTVENQIGNLNLSQQNVTRLQRKPVIATVEESSRSRISSMQNSSLSNNPKTSEPVAGRRKKKQDEKTFDLREIPEEEEENRLPKYILPKHYNLHLNPNFNNKTYNGTVTIKIEILDPSKHIKLHAKDINITSHSFYNEARRFNTDLKFEANNIVKIIPLDEISEGMYFLEFNFSANMLHESSFGIYTTNENNITHMLASQLKPMHAREAFPCFDEPGFKATYDVSIVNAEKGVALFNMPEIPIITYSDEEEEDHKQEVGLVKFSTTVVMSSYLFNIIIGDFVYKERCIDTIKGYGKNFTVRVSDSYFK